MKFFEIIKEIWKSNKESYLISGIIITLGCFLMHFNLGSPLKYLLALGWAGLGVFMFLFGFIINWMGE